ncbi:MAG: hypothetical protein E7675_00725 [Ruminococcaceae bacterium]|nr:hypothetical protein [Oscillospiraceae bacterium]
MFTKNTVLGFGNGIGYEIEYPIVENEKIQTVIDELQGDVAFYFENAFGKRITERLIKRKRGRAYGDFHVTFADGECFSFVILMGGFEGNELVLFEYIPITLDKMGNIVPLYMHLGMPKRKNRPYFLWKEKTVCLIEKSQDTPRIKLGKTELFGLVDYKILS